MGAETAAAGIGPVSHAAAAAVGAAALTAEVTPNRKSGLEVTVEKHEASDLSETPCFFMRALGLEPRTYGLKVRCSTS